MLSNEKVNTILIRKFQLSKSASAIMFPVKGYILFIVQIGHVRVKPLCDWLNLGI